MSSGSLPLSSPTLIICTALSPINPDFLIPCERRKPFWVYRLGHLVNVISVNGVSRGISDNPQDIPQIDPALQQHCQRLDQPES